MATEATAAPASSTRRSSQQTLLELLRHGRHEEALARTSNPDEVNQVDDGSTPLLVATTRGWEDVVVALVKNGANVNVMSELGETPLMRAIKCGKISVDTVRLMLEHGARETINTAAKENAFFAKWTALHFACDRDMNQNPVVVALLVACGASIDAVAANNKTPLDMCTGRTEFLKALNKPLDVLKDHHYSTGDTESMQIGSENLPSDEPRRSSLLQFAQNLFKKPSDKKSSFISQSGVNH